MSDEPEEEATIEFTPAAYPDLSEVPLAEQRRFACLSFLLQAGKAAATAAGVVKEAAVIEQYLLGSEPAPVPRLKAVT